MKRASPEPTKPVHPTRAVLPFWLFMALWFVALALPWGGFMVSPLLGILAGLILPVVWVTQMPTTCMSGGLIAFPMALVQIGSGIGWLAFGIRQLLR